MPSPTPSSFQSCGSNVQSTLWRAGKGCETKMIPETFPDTTVRAQGPISPNPVPRKEVTKVVHFSSKVTVHPSEEIASTGSSPPFSKTKQNGIQALFVLRRTANNNIDAAPSFSPQPTLAKHCCRLVGVTKSPSMSSSSSPTRQIERKKLKLSCPHCPRMFQHLSALEPHIRTHTGEKPFACDKCNARFCQKNNLSRHQKLHEGIRRFACPVCAKRFSRRAHMQRHATRHSEYESESFRLDEEASTAVSALAMLSQS